MTAKRQEFQLCFSQGEEGRDSHSVSKHEQNGRKGGERDELEDESDESNLAQ